MEIEICVGSYCHYKGSPRVADDLRAMLKAQELSDKVNFTAKFCMGQCTHSKGESTVSLKVNGILHSVDPAHTENFFNTVVLPDLAS